MVTERYLGLAADLHRQELEELFDQRHHVVVVGIGPVGFHLRELGIVRPVQAFVPEVLADFEHLLQAADNQPLQVELIGNPHEHLLFEHVVERFKRPRRGPAVNRLQDRRLDLDESALGQEPAHQRGYPRPVDEHLPRLLVHNQVNVALAIAHLDVGEPVELLRQRVERLGQKDQLLHVHGDLAGLRPEHLAPPSHEVAEVKQAQVCERLLAQHILAQIKLQLPGFILNVGELGLPVLPPRHQPSRNPNLENGDWSGHRGCTGLRRSWRRGLSLPAQRFFRAGARRL